MAGYLRALADRVVLPPPARRSRLMRTGRSGWPVGLSRPLADAGTLLRYPMGKFACAVAGPRPKLVGRAVPVSMLDPAERGACPDVVLDVGALLGPCRAPPRRWFWPRPQPAGRCSRALPSSRSGMGHCMLAFPAGAAPPGLLAALPAFFPLEAAPPGDLPGEGEGPEPQAGDPDLGVELDVDEDDEYLLS